ncbi:putative toxin-antitoxin system toxin component, PIN family [bacterium]|nr:putative toxin-antitoxin system toxin component, PIN family [bacterium]
MPKLKVVIDTNIFISATLFSGEANRLVSLWQKNYIQLLMSKQVLEEYLRALNYPKFGLTEIQIKYITEEVLLPYIFPLIVKRKISIIKNDLSDNKFLSLALEGKADFIISGDKHILELKKIENIRIVSLKEFFSFV